MSDVNQQEREFGLAGHPDGDLSGGALAASGQVTMEKVTKETVVFDQDDYEGGEGADPDEASE